MKQKYVQAQEELIKLFIEEEFKSGGCKLQVINSDTWSEPLPDAHKNTKALVFDIVDWSLEESYVTDEGLFLTVVFGKDYVCSRLFSFDEIINVITLDGVVLYQKSFVFYPDATKSKITKQAPSEEYSMLKILERNSHLKKYRNIRENNEK